MSEPQKLKCLFRFNGSVQEFHATLGRTIDEIDYDGREYSGEPVFIGQILSFGIWLQDPKGENPYSKFLDDGLPYEVVCGLFLDYKDAGYDVFLSPDKVNTARDKMGRPTPPMIKRTENTADRVQKEQRFIAALEARAKQENKWQEPTQRQ